MRRAVISGERGIAPCFLLGTPYLSVFLHLTLRALKHVCLNQEAKGFFQFVVIINVLVSPFRFI